VRTAIEEGEPTTVIIDKAAEWNSDAIFLGSHGRKGIEQLLMGSTSENVLRHARCSVEIVRAPVREAAD
jgi:universal stress protein A